MARLHTFLSPVGYRDPAEGANGPSPSVCLINRRADGHGPPLFWLDEMLGGGLEIPTSSADTEPGSPGEPSFMLVLAGPPGTGKSTFALELCYRLATNTQPVSEGNPFSGRQLRSLYISSELTSSRVIENGRSFHWDRERKVFFPFRTGSGQCWRRPREDDVGYCVVAGTEVQRFEALGGIVRQPTEMDLRDPQVFFRWASRVWALTANGEVSASRLNDLTTNSETYGLATQSTAVDFFEHADRLPDVVVVDSLNLLDRSNIAENLCDLRHAIGCGRKHPPLLILVVDGFSGTEPSNTWEFMADAAFRFDAHIGWDGYYQRTFQIMKIKTQSHAWGQHGYKIVEGPRLRDTPYMDCGGSFVFPTVHWHLSRSIRVDDRAQEISTGPTCLPASYRTPFPSLNRLLCAGEADSCGGFPNMQAGFPAQQTTALVGRRGGMKSHLAYHFMLAHALGDQSIGGSPKNVLLVSLRDDMNAATSTLRSILRQQLPGWDDPNQDRVQQLIDADRIEVLYNWPGCVSPGEFFHRIFVALRRPRANRMTGFAGIGSAPTRSTPEVVILNGLDYLESKFPSCANEKVFVPALVSLFRCNRVCSVIIAADEAQGAASSQIRATADLILEFGDMQPEDRAILEGPADSWQTTKVTAVRVPAGRLGGLWGVLARDRAGAMSFVAEPKVEGQ